MANTILEMIKERGDRLKPLYDRMDADRNLYLLSSYEMKDEDGRTVPHVRNVTLADAKHYADRVIAIFNSATRQPVIKGKKDGEKIDDEQTTLMEDFFIDFMTVADDDLSLREDVTTLDTYIKFQLAIRGTMASRVTVFTQDGKLIPNPVLPTDSRYLIWDSGPHGLKWGAYETIRTREQIETQYNLNIGEDEVTVTDFWNEFVNWVYVKEQAVLVQSHPFGMVPFVIEGSGVGARVADKDYLKFTNESIYASNRANFAVKNEMMTILQTLTVGAFFGAMQYASDQGERATMPEMPPWGLRTVMPVEKDGGYSPMPVQDINNAARLGYSILESDLQRGGLPAVDYGNLQFPLSAVAISRLTESKDQIFIPRLQALAMFYRKLFTMIHKQYTGQGLNLDLGEVGERKSYPASKLKGDYTIKFTLFATSPEQNIANLSLANSAAPWLSRDTIVRDFLQSKNPEREQAKKWEETADEEVPTLRLYKQAKSKLLVGETVEAKLIADMLGLTLQQIESGAMIPPPQPAKAPPTEEGPVPLLGEGSTTSPTSPRRSAQEATQLGVIAEQEA